MPFFSWTVLILLNVQWLTWLEIQWKVTMTLSLSQNALLGLMQWLPGPSPLVTIVYSTPPGWAAREAWQEEGMRRQKP